MINKCEMCNIEFDASRKSVKYCSNCRIIKNREIWKKHRDSHKESRHAYDKEYRKAHKQEISTRMVEYNKSYKQNHREERKEYRKNKFEEDLNYKIEHNVRSKLHTFFKSKDDNLYSDLVGCSLNQFKRWLEYNFDRNMNWSNYGAYWHMDHVIPVCVFDLSNDEHLKFCFNWKNTRPLEASVNVSRKYSFFDILIHELKTNFFLRLENDEITNLDYGVSNLQSYSRNCLMDLVNC